MSLPQRNRAIILPLLLLSVLMSCQPPRQDYIRGILSSGCFWDVLNKDLKAKNAQYTYRLLPDGTCYKYQYQYLNGEKQNAVSPIDKDKGEVDIKWSLKSDSVLTIGTEDYKVLKADDRSVWIQTTSSPSFLLQKNCSTYIRD